MSVVLCRFWTVGREQNESKRDYFKYAEEHNNIIMIFVAVKCRTLHNRPHVKPLNTYRLLLYVEEFHPVTNFMFKIAVQRGIGDIKRRFKDKLKKNSVDLSV